MNCQDKQLFIGCNLKCKLWVLLPISLPMVVLSQLYFLIPFTRLAIFLYKLVHHSWHLRLGVAFVLLTHFFYFLKNYNFPCHPKEEKDKRLIMSVVLKLEGLS